MLPFASLTFLPDFDIVALVPATIPAGVTLSTFHALNTKLPPFLPPPKYSES